MRDTNILQSIALLATGDEIAQGDILNTNSQQIASRLMNQHIPIGMHITTGDNIAQIEHAMAFLLQHHKVLIITGGLGPTSDDLTRYALSKLLNRSLVFDERTWENICNRLKRFGYNNPPESNKQQALFPEEATIIPNPNGTAAGCWIQHNQQLIFMLPGPPEECLAMVDSVVLPLLIKNNYQETFFMEKWLLLGASEGKIAEELDSIAKSFDCTTGYRLCYPYLEFKIFTRDKKTLLALSPLVENAIQEYLVGNGKQSASEQLKLKLENFKETIEVCDLATGGVLENTIKTPKTQSHLIFSCNQNRANLAPLILITILGLEEYWLEKKETHKTNVKMKIDKKNNSQDISFEIPLRGERVKLYAVESICKELLRFI